LKECACTKPAKVCTRAYRFVCGQHQ